MKIRKADFSEESADSPCIQVCDMNEETGYCRGCYRTLAEIAGWSNFIDKERKEINRHLARRKELK